MPRVKALCDFYDLSEMCQREEGEIFEVSDERYFALANVPIFGKLVELLDGEPEPLPKQQKERAKRKKD